MSSIASVSAAGNPPWVGAPPRSPANLDAEKAQCERQLSDWVHCVSASTPEGKAKIAEYTTKLGEINAKIKAADKSAPAAIEATRAPVADGSTTLGRVVDVYA